MKGGTGVNYSEVLGKKFRTFMTLLNQSGYEAFTFQYAKAGSKIGEADNKDIRPDFFRYILALSYALNQLETPSGRGEAKAKEAEDSVKYIVRGLVDGGTGTTRLSENSLNVEQFLFQLGNADVPHLLPGFNLFGLHENTYGTNASKQYTSLQKLVYFLYAFIAQLDLTKNLDADKVNAFLVENDNLYYNPMVIDVVNDVEKLIKDTPHEKKVDKDLIVRGVYEGAKQLTKEILKELQQVGDGKTDNDIWKKFSDAGSKFDAKFATTNINVELEKAPTGVGLFGNDANGDAEYAKIAAELKALKKLIEVKVAMANPTPSVATEFIKNGLYNYHYLAHVNKFYDKNTVPGASGAGSPDYSKEALLTLIAAHEGGIGGILYGAINRGYPYGKTQDSKEAWDAAVTAVTNAEVAAVAAGGVNKGIGVSLKAPSGGVSKNSAKFLYNQNPPTAVVDDKWPLITEKASGADGAGKSIKIYGKKTAAKQGDVANLITKLQTIPYTKNSAKAAIVGLLNYQINNSVDTYDSKDHDLAKIKEEIEKALKGYGAMSKRLGYLDSLSVRKATKKLEEAFLGGVLGKIIKDPIFLASGGPRSKNTNFRDAEVVKFYKQKYVKIKPTTKVFST